MTKYSQYKMETQEKKKLVVHPVWRGIGCVLVILIPIIAYFASSELIDRRGNIPWLIIPKEIIMNEFRDPYLFVKLIYGAIITLLIFMILTIITFILNSIFGPSRFGPFDVPPEKAKKQ